MAYSLIFVLNLLLTVNTCSVKSRNIQDNFSPNLLVLILHVHANELCLNVVCWKREGVSYVLIYTKVQTQKEKHQINGRVKEGLLPRVQNLCLHALFFICND